MEADVFPLRNPDLSIQIDGAIGERSDFHQSFGYYAHGVDEATATLPEGWKQRLVPIRNPNTNNATGWCLEAHDLAASKLVAGRPKDIDFLKTLLREDMVQLDTLAERVNVLPLPAEQRTQLQGRLRRISDDRNSPSDYSF